MNPTIRDLQNLFGNTFRVWKLGCHAGKQDKFNGLASQLASRIHSRDIPCGFHDQHGFWTTANPDTEIPDRAIPLYKQLVQEANSSKSPVLRNLQILEPNGSSA